MCIRATQTAHSQAGHAHRALTGLWLALLSLVLLLGIAMIWQSPAEQAGATACAASANRAAQSLAEHGIDIRTTRWQQRQERAVQACENDFPDLRWLQYTP